MTLHYSVLKNEVIDNLNIKDDGIYVDATVGYAFPTSRIVAHASTSPSRVTATR